MATHAVSPLAPAPQPLATVAGARFAMAALGLRYTGRPDLLLIELAEGTTVAGVFATSTLPGHPVRWCRAKLPGGRARAVLVNAGQANTCRGAEGDAACAAEAEAVAAALGCPADEVFLASTGVIGQALPVGPIVAAVPDLVRSLAAEGAGIAARAIMTTDTFAKAASRTTTIGGATVTLTGIAKGSGMIAPDMATMLAFVVTDAAVAAPVLQELLEQGCAGSFNSITVDGDMSTSDTLLLLATAQAGHPLVTHAQDLRLAAFRAALDDLLQDLAVQVVRDGEGAGKLVTITVDGAVDAASAKAIGLSVANSPLVKTALAAGDANWGRVVMAVGKANQPIEPARLAIAFGGVAVVADGGAVADLDEAPVAAHLAGREVDLAVTVGAGPGRARVWTCDLTHAYIDINANYRS